MKHPISVSTKPAAGHTFYLEPIERIVIEMMWDELRQPALIASYVQEYVAERVRLSRSQTDNRVCLEREINDLDRAIERLVDVLANTDGQVPQVLACLAAIQEERGAITAKLAKAPRSVQPLDFHPKALRRYQEQLETLRNTQTIGDDAEGLRAMEYLRDLVSSVTVHRDATRVGGIKVRVLGKLNGLLAPSPIRCGGRW